MIKVKMKQALFGIVIASFFALHASTIPAQQPDTESVTQKVDAAVKSRIDSLAGYTVTEHYAVFRSNDEIHAVAEMMVNSTYDRDSGKSYVIVSQSGSAVVRDLVLKSILDNEKHLNQPGIREGAWITSANYELKLKPGGAQLFAGRNCAMLTLTPKRQAPYLFEGTLWVDSEDGSIVQLQGTTSKSPSMFTGPTQLLRQYANIGGFSEATHARAETYSSMFGKTIVKIDYLDYRIRLRPAL
jgi:hypothetical protein